MKDMGKPDSAIPSWIRKWIIFTTVIQIYDGAFCLLRPHSLGDGWIGKVYYLYRYYVETDLHYGNSKDSFSWAQGLGNIIEALLYCMVLFNCLQDARLTKLLCIVVSTMTSWKTVLYFLFSMDIPEGGHAVPCWTNEILMVTLPSLLWICAPALSAYTLLLDFGGPRTSRGSPMKNNKSNDDDNRGHAYNLRNRKA